MFQNSEEMKQATAQETSILDVTLCDFFYHHPCFESLRVHVYMAAIVQ